MRSAGRHRRTFETHGLGLCLTSGPGGPTFPLRVEEEGTGHPATGRMQLPVPKISVWAGKAPGVRHFDPLCSDEHEGYRRISDWFATNRRRYALSRRHPICGDRTPVVATVPGIWARSTPRLDRMGVLPVRLTSTCPAWLPRDSRIRADPGAVDLQTLDRFSSFDKSLITNFVDLDDDFFPVAGPTGSTNIQPAGCVIAHTTQESRFSIRQWLIVGERLLSAVSCRIDCAFLSEASSFGDVLSKRRRSGVRRFDWQ